MNHVRTRVTTEAQLRELIAEPIDRVRDKVRPELADVHRSFLAASRLYFVATADGAGNLDVSPKGDPEGAVLVLDERTVALPDRPGNRRLDGLKNLLQNPHIAIEFVVPGRGDTLRINGTATVLADAEYAPRMAAQGKLPVMITEVAIEEVFFHCSKAFLRAQAWDPSTWPSADDDHGVPLSALY
ncbi:MSMEG_1061 family FMN-dependent PPOX-type flavoprotein [Tsukamurella ocularis]|uniref:MSMEG_1061 family FMN-dependent PPOX-type flavoprotein n=1 Tax=Tsukamurella ocularis TaxID=1970234 RepID=UPI0039F0BDDE